MFENYLLAGVFIAVIVMVIGFWWRRYPRHVWVVGTEAGWWLGGYVLTYYLVHTLTANMPDWIAIVGIIAHGVLWAGVFGPVASRRIVRRLGP